VDSLAAAKSSQSGNEAPRIGKAQSRLIVGLQENYTLQTRQNIPSLWQRFAPHIGRIPGQTGNVAYGVCTNRLPNPWRFDYMAGVEVANASPIPEGFTLTKLPEALYAIFAHRQHVSVLPVTLEFIHDKWFPSSGYVPLRGAQDQPYLVERYGEAFDPMTGMGDIEIWIPVERKL
jgi:AraC family transcriptional regulator